MAHDGHALTNVSNSVVAEEHDPFTKTWKASDLGITFDDATASVSPLTQPAVSPAVGVVARPGTAGRLPPYAPPKVVVAPNLEMTLPPREQRHSLDDRGERQHSREAAPDSAQSIRPRLWSVISIATLFVGAVAYGVASGLLDPDPADAREPGPFFPEHGQAPSSATPTASTPARSGALPPELAATLAQALPTTPTSAVSAPADAGTLAPDALTAGGAEAAPGVARVSVVTQPPAPTADSDPASAPSASPDNPGRADRLRASLERRRAAPSTAATVAAHEAPPPDAEPEPERTSTPPESALLLPTPPTALQAGLGETLVETRVATDDVDGVDPARSSAPRAVPQPANAAVLPLMTYTYGATELYSVATARERVTDIALQDGEKLLARPNAGDASRWVISVLDSGPQVHVFVRPLRSGLRTNLTITTDRRSYFLEMSSADEGPYMAGVQWRYPTDDAARRRDELQLAERERASTTAVSALDALRFDYRITVAEGQPRWKPIMVFDDGTKTFIRFPRPIGVQGPALFIPQSRTQRATYLNYRIKGDLYVLDRLIDAAELRMPAPDSNDGAQEVVRIVRRLGR